MPDLDMDKTAREKIKYNISSNYFVEAGAGSGKTSVLVERMASMVESGIDISKICAITFTKAAAGEFYARFQARLARSESANARQA
ncbi:MAG: UvrD-helicase domain-containing protein, partial [Firmicutes bacterium]|nr:UvrD-helicase domain-containing protein [Bacillota bacterium]MDY5857520.1 UvrD-helicase domain-containing protein [Anaerovoracaceae bacterium]